MLTIAVSSRALFHIEDGDHIFVTQGQEAFDDYMRSKENQPLRPGTAFPLIKKLLALNDLADTPLVEVSMLSRNSPDAAMRISRSIEHYGLNIERAVFVRGDDRFKYVSAIGTPLFLSATPADVKKALENGIAAATMLPCERSLEAELANPEIRIAFDGDAVLFSNESDMHYQAHGLGAFEKYEKDNAHIPLGDGPFKNVLLALNHIQQQFPVNECPLKVGLITARSVQSNSRVFNTLRSWGIQIDAFMFAAGSPKGPWLKAFGADVFFDDTHKNIANAFDCNISSGHVPYGTGEGIVKEVAIEAKEKAADISELPSESLKVA